MIEIIENTTIENYESYREMMLEEAKLIVSDKKRYIKTTSISASVKIYALDQMIDFFYLEDENLIVEELLNIRRAIIVRHFLNRMFGDI